MYGVILYHIMLYIMLPNFYNILDNTDSILWFPCPLPAIGRPPPATTHRHADYDLQSYPCKKKHLLYSCKKNIQ